MPDAAASLPRARRATRHVERGPCVGARGGAQVRPRAHRVRHQEHREASERHHRCQPMLLVAGPRTGSCSPLCNCASPPRLPPRGPFCTAPDAAAPPADRMSAALIGALSRAQNVGSQRAGREGCRCCWCCCCARAQRRRQRAGGAAKHHVSTVSAPRKEHAACLIEVVCTCVCSMCACARVCVRACGGRPLCPCRGGWVMFCALFCLLTVAAAAAAVAAVAAAAAATC